MTAGTTATNANGERVRCCLKNGTAERLRIADRESLCWPGDAD